MAENIPPTTAVSNGTSAAVAGGSDSVEQLPNRGIPYYEKLRRELRDTLQKKRLMDKNMVPSFPPYYPPDCFHFS
jgi:chromatin modification-related protein EAF6